MNKKIPFIMLSAIFVVALVAVTNAVAITYDVSRSFNGATLIGTVEIAEGNYTIMELDDSPFANIDLILSINGTSYALSNALTGIIRGTGQFLITASSTELIFSTSNADGSNPADLVFSDNLNAYSLNRYAIGSDGNPGFEVAYTTAGEALHSDLSFPLVFGTATAVPEPATMLLLGSGLVGLAWMRRKK